MKDSANRAIGRKSNKPRVHIEIDVEGADGAPEKVTLAHKMAVMAALSGANQGELEEVADRKFEEFDQENFNAKLAACKPRVKMQVPNKLGGDGTLDVDMTFKSMEDFRPDRIAEEFGPLKKLYAARRSLEEAKTWAGNNRDRKKALTAILKKLKNDPGARKAISQLLEKVTPPDAD